MQAFTKIEIKWVIDELEIEAGDKRIEIKY